ncbi:uncharacterized protein LTR77_007188 [Saxophila tyrrhenica]|uniref:Pentatricopeptide repeat-containing protein n=1 Tax=Saxophila tyrrhenica TaxID=1690608 RepID=A0AAV9P3V7_9PEZI|nr:hypothetical protein LTR77_007188 [Saxophila tyrrhenica]
METYMQSPLQFAVTSKLHEDDFVERKPDQVERLIHRVGADFLLFSHRSLTESKSTTGLHRSKHYGVMTSLLLRFGTQLEARLGSQTLWNSGKRKRGDRVCADCRRRGAMKQRRAYSDDSVSVGAAGYNPFEPRNTEDANHSERRSFQRVSRPEMGRPRRSGWGLTADEAPSQHEDAAKELTSEVIEQQQTDIWEQFEQAGDETSADIETWEDAARVMPRSDYRSQHEVELDFDYRENLPPALRERNSDMVARCLVVAERNNDLDFIRSLSASTFSQCIELLQPCHMTEQLASAHLEISGAMANMMGISSMRRVAWEHSRMLEVLLAVRRSADLKLSADDYRMLLQAAKDLGHRNMAVRLWTRMREQGVAPDIACYNHYMGATVLNGMFNPAVRHSMRVTAFHMLARRTANLGKSFANYRLGPGGLKKEILRAFGEMLQGGIIADEESFRLVIMAAAREGDTDMVKSVLKKVWNVDVDALFIGRDGGAAPEPKKLEPSSPLYPSPKLLFAIAHAFGINNNVPAALRTVDFVARHFNVPIDLQTWAQLFEWTFVLAMPRTGAQARRDNEQNTAERAGKLPLQSVLSLWDTMTSAPYNVKPTMGMYNYLIRNLERRDMLDELVNKMHNGRQLYREHRREERKAWRSLKQAVMPLLNPRLGEQRPAPPMSVLQSLRRNWEHQALVRLRNIFWLKRWLRLFLWQSSRRVRIDDSGDWILRHLPSILWHWRGYAQNVVSYETSDGFVEIRFRTEAEIERGREATKEKRARQAKVLDLVPLDHGEWWVRKRNTRDREEEVRREPREGEFEAWDRP